MPTCDFFLTWWHTCRCETSKTWRKRHLLLRRSATPTQINSLLPWKHLERVWGDTRWIKGVFPPGSYDTTALKKEGIDLWCNCPYKTSFIPVTVWVKLHQAPPPPPPDAPVWLRKALWWFAAASQHMTTQFQSFIGTYVNTQLLKRSRRKFTSAKFGPILCELSPNTT